MKFPFWGAKGLPIFREWTVVFFSGGQTARKWEVCGCLLIQLSPQMFQCLFWSRFQKARPATLSNGGQHTSTLRPGKGCKSHNWKKASHFWINHMIIIYVSCLLMPEILHQFIYFPLKEKVRFFLHYQDGFIFNFNPSVPPVDWEFPAPSPWHTSELPLSTMRTLEWGIRGNKRPGGGRPSGGRYYPPWN